MVKINYSLEQISELEQNKYVLKVTKTYITFTKECKLEAIRLSNKRYFYKDIFIQLWFPRFIIESEIPRNSLNRWKKILKNTWTIHSNKWRKKKEKIDFNNMTLKEENEYLKAKVAYLEELQKLKKQDYP